MKPDWIIHYILDAWPSSHTHGLSRYGGLELELNLPVSQEKAMMILNLLGMEIAEKGKHYRSGDRESDVFLLPVYFFETAPAVPDAYFIYGETPELPNEGYYTLNDPTCGSGSLLLASVDCLARKGINPSEQLVIQASDLDITCVQMTYIQLALYGVPAVVIRGDVLTLREYDRWYTPAYLLGKWVWRAPQPFGARMNESDERLKMLEEPMYAAFRLAEQFMRKGKEC